MAQAHRGVTSKPNRRGFTVVELVVVIAVIATVSAVAIPRFASASARSRLEAASSRIVQDIGLVAASASAIGADRQIVFNAPSDEYVMMGVAGRGRFANRTVKMGTAPYNTNIVSAVFEGAPLLTCNGFGLSETDGTIDLAVGRYGKRILITGGTTTIRVRSFELNASGDGDVMPSVRQVTSDVSIDSGRADAGMVQSR